MDPRFAPSRTITFVVTRMSCSGPLRCACAVQHKLGCVAVLLLLCAARPATSHPQAANGRGLQQVDYGPGCVDECPGGTRSGICADGGPGAEDSSCLLGTDCSDCGPRVMSPPPPPRHPSTLCDNSCQYAHGGVCDDGGDGAEYHFCEIGTDCTDCGSRYPPEGRQPIGVIGTPLIVFFALGGFCLWKLMRKAGGDPLAPVATVQLDPA